MTLRTRLLASFLAILMFTVGLAAINYRMIGSLLETSSWVDHTHEVIGKAYLLEKLLVDMETGERGFLIAGKEEFLEPYAAGIDSFRATMTSLKGLVADNPTQSESLNRIDALAAKWHEVAARPEIAERRKVAADAVDADYLQALLAEGRGKRILDEMRIEADQPRRDLCGASRS